MAMAVLLALLLVAPLPLASAASSDAFVVTGRVYCDACSAGHFSKSSFFVPGATVGVQCSSRQAALHVTADARGTTDENGVFRIPVGGDHEHELCVAMLLRSAHPTCNILAQKTSANVLLTRNAGLASNVVNTGPFSLKQTRVPESCAAELSAETKVED